MTTLSPLSLTPVHDAVECCTPVTGGAMEVEEARTLARIFKALGDPTRIRLLSIIAARDAGEACVCDLTGLVGLSQPTVSHHMKQLVDAGLVTREQRGRWAHYAVVPGAFARLASALDPGSAGTSPS